MDSTEERELREEVLQSQEASKEIIRDHLSDYLSRNPDGSFTSWIADLHPENVNVDDRLTKEDSEWLLLWRAQKSMLPPMPCSSPPPTHEPIEPQSSGLIELIFGSSFTLFTITFVFGMELLMSLLLKLARIGFSSSRSALSLPAPRFLSCIPAALSYTVASFFYLAASCVGVFTQLSTYVIAFSSYLIIGVLSLSHQRGAIAFRTVRGAANTTAKEARRRFAATLDEDTPQATNCDNTNNNL